MERNPETTFYANGCRYRVIEGDTDTCDGCCFIGYGGSCNKPSKAGHCSGEYREDGIEVYFVED